jgi:hypothetical protein
MSKGYKIIITGHIIEVYEYERSFSVDKQEKERPEVNLDVEKIDNKERGNNYSRQRTRNNLRRLILSNFSDKDRFVTLTFEDNITDIETANKEFKKFIQRVVRQYKDFKYVAVIEFQKRGAVHYHMICNLPAELLPGKGIYEQEMNFMLRYWQQGYVDIKDIKGVDNVGAYLLKYLQKSFNDVEGVKVPEGKKRYLHSKNLNEPIEVESGYIADILKQVRQMYPVYTSNYMSEFNGSVEYKEYNLRRE